MKEHSKSLLTLNELLLEKGVGADDNVVKMQMEKITSKWIFPESSPKNPRLVLFGGFQGSGKTTALEYLQRDPGVLVVSPDEIRNNLFADGWQVTEDFVRMVNATKFALVEYSVGTGYHVVIDQALTPDRVALTHDLLNSHDNYSPMSVFLYAPIDVLRQRVTTRPVLPGRYRGTVSELEASLDKYVNRYGEPKFSDYDLAINTFENKPDEVAQKIRQTIF